MPRYDTVILICTFETGRGASGRDRYGCLKNERFRNIPAIERAAEIGERLGAGDDPNPAGRFERVLVGLQTSKPRAACWGTRSAVSWSCSSAVRCCLVGAILLEHNDMAHYFVAHHNKSV
jgi:hypothetical protein